MGAREHAVVFAALGLLGFGCGHGDASLIDAGDAAASNYKVMLDVPANAARPFSSSGRPEPSACMRQMASFVGPNAYNYTVDWSPSSNLLLTGTIGAMRVLEADLEHESVSEVARFEMPDSQVYAKWAPDGHYAVSAGQDVRLLRVDGEPPRIREVARYTGHTGPVIAVAWSRDGSRLLTGAKDESVRVLAVDRGKAQLVELAVFHEHVGRVFDVAWSPDGRHAVSGGEDRSLRLLAADAVSGTLRELAQVKSVDWRNSVSWGPDGLVLSGDWGLFNRAEMWTVDDVDGSKSFAAQGVLTDFDRVGVQVLAWNSAGTLLAAGAHDSGLQLFSYADHHFEGLGALQNWQHGVHAASWSPNSQHLALAAAFGERIALLDVRNCLAPSK